MALFPGDKLPAGPPRCGWRVTIELLNAKDEPLERGSQQFDWNHGWFRNASSEDVGYVLRSAAHDILLRHQPPVTKRGKRK